MLIDKILRNINLTVEGGDPNSGGGAPKDEPKVEATPTLKEVINSVKEGIEKLEPEVKEEDKPQPKTEAKKEEVKKEDEKKEDLTEEQLTTAKNIYKALSSPDPKIQTAALNMLANAAGLKLENVKTEVQQEKAEETLLDLLKVGLGEYDFLADKIAPALEKALDKLVDKKTKDIREEQKEAKLTKERENVNNQANEAFAEFTNALDLKDDVMKMMDSIRPSDKSSPKAYFRALIILAAEQKGVKLLGKNDTINKDKVTRNRTDADIRIASERGAEVKEAVSTVKFRTLKDAVRDAAEKQAESMAGGKK